jgi:hypothetical protein
MMRRCTMGFLMGVAACSAAVAQREPARTHGGACAVRIENRTAQWKPNMDMGFDRHSSMLPVAGGDRLKIGFWMRSDKPTSAGIARVTVAASGSKWINDTDYLRDAVVPPVWTYYSADYQAPPGATRINLGFRPAFGGNAVLIDDVSVVNVTAGNKELVADGGFENWLVDKKEPVGWRFFLSSGTSGSIDRATAPAKVDADY